MIEWLRKDEFWKIYEMEYKPQGRYLNDVAYFDAPLEIISKVAKTEPVSTPADEGDFPGPVLRWYARVNGDLVLVTYFIHDEESVNLDFEDDSESQVLENVFYEFRKIGFDVTST